MNDRAHQDEPDAHVPRPDRTWLSDSNEAASRTPGRHGPFDPRLLGDFSTDRRLWLISIMAIIVGAFSTLVALVLLRLIGLFTNIFFYQRLETELVSPANSSLGPFILVIPVTGGLIVGVMARYGSERIRGHGIPEAIEAILLNGSRVQPRVALLKPLSSAIVIGSGGPFGAEGPIIMTGGAFGSLFAQYFRLTSFERRTLLVAGAAAGMSATFATPIAAILLSVELLLFEWKPRSFVPVALASVTAAVFRRYLLGAGPLFPTPQHPAYIGIVALLACVIAGLASGALSLLLTQAVYAAEDAFHRLPIHWMWWPAIGGLAIGIGGLIFPPALGVGYDVIERLLSGEAGLSLILGILIVKSAIWAISLGSGTSGGVLAPLLMIGGAVGGLEAYLFPNEGLGFWPLISMAAVLGGTMRSPLTGIVFAVELTGDFNLLLPLVVSVVVAHGFTVMTLRRSILTEKVSRRGFHLSREYAIDPLEILFVREVMRSNVVALSPSTPLASLAPALEQDRALAAQRLIPVTGDDGELIGVVTQDEARRLSRSDLTRTVGDVCEINPVIALAGEPLRLIVHRMAETGRTRLPVVSAVDDHRLLGMISLSDLLQARRRNLDAERRRERILGFRSRRPARHESAELLAATGPAWLPGDENHHEPDEF